MKTQVLQKTKQWKKVQEESIRPVKPGQMVFQPCEMLSCNSKNNTVHYSLIRMVKDSAGEKFLTLEIPPASIFWTSFMSLQLVAHFGRRACLWHLLQGLSKRFPISKSNVAHVDGLFSILASR